MHIGLLSYLNFVDLFSQNNEISKSVQWEPSCSVRADRHRTKLIVSFRNFLDALENHVHSDSRLCI